MRSSLIRLAAAAALAAASPAFATQFMWTFSGGDLTPARQDGGTVVMDYFTPATQSRTSFGNTASDPGVPDAPDGATDFLFADVFDDGGAGGYTLDYTGVPANGGGIYVNNYTLIFDINIPVLAFTPLFNTNETHANDADFYVGDDGSVGIGAIGYSSGGLIQPGAWHRVAFVRNASAGFTKYYIDGVEVFSGVAGAIDGRFSLYTDAQLGTDLLIYGEGDASGNYTNPSYLSSLLFADFAIDGPSVAALGGVKAAGIGSPPPPAPQWASPASGDWNNAGNWIGPVPNAVDAEASFLAAIGSPQTIFTNAPVTVGSLRFDNDHGYQIAGQGSLTIEVSAASGRIEVKRGSHKINLPLFLADNTTADVSEGAALLIADPLTLLSGSTLTKSGAGLLVIEAPVRDAGAATLDVAGGAVALNYDAGRAATGGAPAQANLTVRVSGSRVVLGADQTLAGLDAVASNPGEQSIDLAGHAVRVYASDRAAAEAAALADIRAAFVSGSGIDGIHDSTAGAGQRVGATDQAIDARGDAHVLVRLSFAGDANLDGAVDVSDLGLLASQWQQAGAWDQGDFNYDGSVDVSDLGDLATQWQAGVTGPLAPGASFEAALRGVGLAGAIPEPAGASLLAAALLAGAARRRRG